jgi:2-methylisocitrate lyase-like PEP mutase family enzyme
VLTAGAPGERADLVELLGRPGIAVAPGVYDALSACLAEAAGFGLVYLSGASIAYTRLGRPDVGLLGLADIADTLARIRERCEVSVIVDCDTGFGNALNVMRSVRVLEQGGAGAIQLEDQDFPKRCGHLRGKHVIAAEAMCGKLRAALDARRSERTLIIARTDALAVDGVDAAIDRAWRYHEVGADLLFVEGIRSREQGRRILQALRGGAPLMANMVEGGVTPMQTAAELDAEGYALVIFPGALVRTVVAASQALLATLRSDGSTAAMRDRMLDFEALNALLGTPELLGLGKRYDHHSKE